MQDTYDNMIQSKSWRGNHVLNNDLFEEIELIFNEFLNKNLTDTTQYSKLREKIHQELEYGSGVFVHCSEVLKCLDKNKFQEIFNKFSLWLGVPAAINKQGDYIKDIGDKIVVNITIKDSIPY